LAEVTSLTVPTAYTNYSLDLDALASSKGIARDADFFVRFRAYGHNSYDFYLDDVRIVAGDLTGPRVLSHSPVALGSAAGPLSAVRVTFDEPIAASSFEPDGRDVELKDAAGTAIAPLSVAPVAGSGDTQFDVTFAAQNLRGTYRLKVGPQIADASGNLMNQNGNAINGEAADSTAGRWCLHRRCGRAHRRRNRRRGPRCCTTRRSRTGRRCRRTGRSRRLATERCGGQRRQPARGRQSLAVRPGTSAGGVSYPDAVGDFGGGLTGYESADGFEPGLLGEMVEQRGRCTWI
jgi:hypothetical protein